MPSSAQNATIYRSFATWAPPVKKIAKLHIAPSVVATTTTVAPSRRVLGLSLLSLMVLEPIANFGCAHFASGRSIAAVGALVVAGRLGTCPLLPRVREERPIVFG